MLVEIVILRLKRYKAEPRCLQKTGGLAILLAVYIIDKLLWKNMQRIKLQLELGVLSNYAPRGRDFLWKNIGPG